MIVGIDASNIRSGGGLTHLKELLAAAEPKRQGIERVIVWAGRRTLEEIPDRSWLEKSHHPWLDRSLPYRVLWQRRQLPKFARRARCAVLFSPGGLTLKNFRPVVTMCQNLLPFEWREIRRYGVSWMLFRLLLLRHLQSSSFRRADGVIFLSYYAQKVVSAIAGPINGNVAIIPHGVNERFFCKPRPQQTIAGSHEKRPFRIIYVSIVDVYKHQWMVAEAVARLRRKWPSVKLELVGPANPPAFKRLQATKHRFDPGGVFIRYRGFVPHSELPELYREADLCVFASSCENLPNILLESMAAGLPIACSNRGPMPEVLGDAGIYFDPEDPEDIADAVCQLIESPDLRTEKASLAFERAQKYSWRRCSDETFSFLAKVALAHENS